VSVDDHTGDALPLRSPLRRRMDKVSSVIARAIVADLRGKPPSTMLPPEAVMLEKYQVGRASLREALRILEVHGLIAIRPGPGGGPMVAPLDTVYFARMSALYLHLLGATYHEVLKARIVVEPVMVRLAAQREDRDALTELEQFLALAEPADESQYLRQAGGFHGLISGLSGNRVLDLEGRSLKDMYADRIEGMVFPPEARKGILADHRRIAQAIIAGKANRAEKLMRAHMEEYLFYSAERNPGVLDEVVQWK
jgi:GntR family transcriptional regulator, transcriptional repressor for pyruvate dehydrogenase complex